MNDFSQLDLNSTLLANLAKNEFTVPTPVQAQAIPPALGGQDVVATAQTGTGKTLAFALPIINALSKSKASGIRAVVLSPTRELAIQISEAFNKIAFGTGVKSAVVVGGMDEMHQRRMLKQGVQVVIATPGRLCDFIDRGLVRLAGVQTMVLDEADRMLDMGFLPSLRAIFEQVPEERQTLLFSATIEKSVAHLIEEYTTNAVRIAIGSATKPAEHVNLHLYEVEQDRKLDLLTGLLRKEKGTFLVFARTRRGTDRLAQRLERAGVKAARIHGDRTQGQRNQALRGFKEGFFRVLVATDVAARGIHVDGIAHVINYDLPAAPEDFIHRVGRTGRAGLRGTATTFSTRSERGEIRKIERALKLRLTQIELPSNLPIVDYDAPAKRPARKAYPAA